MTPPEIRRLLQKRLAQARAAMGPPPVVTTGEVLDDADEADRHMAREIHALTTTRQVALVKDIGAALTRLAEGDYGICTSCNNPVQPTRLTAIPEAERCVSCQRAHELAMSHDDDAAFWDAGGEA